jgi:hypothetical protein
MISMTVIARDAVASDHLVYAWPFPLGPECEVTCADDEQVVMCPAWLVGDRLGPGRHRWRTPDPTRPVAAFFVLTAPVEVAFDMTTLFLIPSTGQPIRIRAAGSMQVRCADPGLLIAQFVGLPFDHVNDGILRSVSRSIERMLARLLTRRVVMAASPIAVTDPGMLPGIVEELVAYNPTAGAVFGVDLIRMGHLVIVADDGATPVLEIPSSVPANGEAETARTPASAPEIIKPASTDRHAAVPPAKANLAAASGEILVKKPAATPPSAMPAAVPAPPVIPETAPSSGAVVDVPRRADDITQPGLKTPVPGSVRLQTPVPGSLGRAGTDQEAQSQSRGSILGIGMSHIGSGSVAGEIPTKVPPGGRVLVPGPNGLMQSATVRQLLQGYYELEVGSSGETIWVPINGVVPE